MGKNTSNELNTECVISVEASRMLPIPVFVGGRASFSTLIQMTSTIHLCKAFFPLFAFQKAGNFSHSIILGGRERDVGSFEDTQLKDLVILPIFSLTNFSSKNT